jgi:hypothetical protein
MSRIKTLFLLITIVLLHNKNVLGQTMEVRNELFKGPNIILYVGENDSYVYKLLLSDTVIKPTKKAKLIAVSKENKKNIIDLPLKGFPEIGEYYKELDFNKCIVQEERIVIFWTKSTHSSEELYVETYDPLLQKTNSAKKIYTNAHAFDLERRIAAKHKSTIAICTNPDRKNELFIGVEIPAKDDYIQLEYFILKDDLFTVSLKKIALPLQLKSKWFDLSFKYHYLENGNVLIRSISPVEAGKSSSNGNIDGDIQFTDANQYHTISYLDVQTNDIVTIELPVSNNSFLEVPIQFVFVGNELQIYALYATKVRSDKPEGLFYAGINTNDLSKHSQTLPFEQAILDAMYEEKSQHPYILNDVKIKDENLLFYLSDGTMYKGAAYIVLEYSTDHELLRFGNERDF